MSIPSPALSDSARCPCGSGDVLGACCGPVLRHERRAGTAQALMRSRYTAFALRDLEHLLASWHPRTRPAPEELTESLRPDVRWLRLEVLATERGGPFDDTGTVEFIASSKSPQGRHKQHEVSRFVREDGAWYYVDGDA